MKRLIVIIGIIGLLASTTVSHPPPIPPKNWNKIKSGVKHDSTDVTTALQTALNTAQGNSGYLVLDSGVYLLTDSIVVPEGVTFEGNKAKLQFEISGQKKAIVMESNTAIRNFVIDVDSVTAITGSGAYGTGITIGMFTTGQGYNNIVVENITIQTEREDADGIIILGESHDIVLNNIYFPKSTTMGRAISLHWGGNDSIQVASDSGNTHHPHNIKISNVTIDTMTYTAGSKTVGIHLSSAYNVKISNVKIQYTETAIQVTVGDYGFRYASGPSLDSARTRGEGIVFDGIFADSLADRGVDISGQALLIAATADSNYANPVRVINSSFRGDQTGVGFVTDHTEGVIIDNCTFSNFDFGMSTGSTIKRLKVLNSTFIDNQSSGISISNSDVAPVDVLIENCYTANNDLGGTDKDGIIVSSATRTIIRNNRIGLASGEGAFLGIDITGTHSRTTIIGNHVFGASLRAYDLRGDSSDYVAFWGNTSSIAGGILIGGDAAAVRYARKLNIIGDTTWFQGIQVDGTAPLDNEIVKYDLAAAKWTFEADVGAAGGTTDSIAFSLGDTTKWQVDKALKIKTGVGLLNTPIADSGGTDTTTLSTALGTSVDLTAEVTGTLPVANGGTGVNSFPTRSALLTDGGGAIAADVLFSGEVLIGSSSGIPVGATITGGTRVTIVNGVNSITVNHDDPTMLEAFTFGHLSKAFFDTTTSRVDPLDSIIIAANAIGDAEIDWGLSAGQVNISDVPAANWRYFISDGTGAMNSLSFGPSGSVVTSTGSSSALTFGNGVDTSIVLAQTDGSATKIFMRGDSVFSILNSDTGLVVQNDGAGNSLITVGLEGDGTATTLRIKADTIDINGGAVASLTGNNLSLVSGAIVVDVLDTTTTTVNHTQWDEFVKDQVGDMVTGNTETNITVTYQDADNTLDFVVAGGSGAFDDVTGDTARYVGPNADTALIVTSNGTGDTRITVGKESDGTATTLSIDIDSIIFSTGSLVAGDLQIIDDALIDLTTEVTGTLPVASGGTGATTLTDGGILLGSGTGAVTALGVATNGQIPIGDGTTDPVLATITGGNGVTITNGAGTITPSILGRVKSIFYPFGGVGGAGSGGPGDSAIVTLPTHDGQGSYVLYKDSSIAGTGTMTDTAYIPFTLPSWCNTVDSVIFVFKGLSATANIAEISKVEVWGPTKLSTTWVSDSSYFNNTTARNSTSVSRIALNVNNTQFAPGDPMTVMIETTLGATSVSVVYVYSVYAKGSE